MASFSSQNNGNNNSNNSNNNSDKHKEDLDLFLTNIESKLRGPFSSLDLSKAVTTSALRKTMTPPEFLENLNNVLLRTDKVSQLRILIGLLGLEPEPELDEKVLQVLRTAQQKSEEPWSKCIAGIIQGIMFKTNDDDDDDNNNDNDSRCSCRGEYAQRKLDKAAEDICERVMKCMRETKEINGGEYPPDLNAYYIPYKYSMVSDDFRKKAQLDPYSNPHFTANLDADILKIDEQLEAQRAKEAQEHGPILLPGVTLPSSTTTSTTAAALGRTNLPPGFKPANLVKKATPKSTSSMFLTRSNPAARKAQLAGRTNKLVRRKGGAQSLIAGTSYKARTAGTTTTSTTTTGTTTTTAAVTSKTAPGAAGAKSSNSASTTTSTTAAAGLLSKKLGKGGLAARDGAAAPRGRFASGKSKMKMLDVDTVSNLHQQTVERQKEQALSKMSKKRRIMEAAKLQGLKRSKPNNEKTTTTATTGAATAATLAPKEPETKPPQSEELPLPQEITPIPEPSGMPAVSAAAALVQEQQAQEQQDQQQPQPEWKILLRERSNKLSDPDRSRVQQFFENNQFNPTPEQSVYKMKLHEQRSVDPATGKEIKETFYLELDYEKKSSKQSKKIKRY
ncbi:unnamed protein product [Cylindrotheca closterium]|uniref:Uncharacterized protein n=1 Tax=Cylindrotheca closterium TaxID=2856 RepID=A0AAD2FF11_9STRA|nr:unnamed protein product [Cylindrotheca closterium]